MLGFEHEDGPLDVVGQGAMALHFRWAKEDDGTEGFVRALLGEADEQVELLPVVGRCEALPVPHCRPLSAQRYVEWWSLACIIHNMDL